MLLDVESAISDSENMITQRYQHYVERRDGTRKMARYYAMDVSETLFGDVCLSRRWGRIGARGQSKIHVFQSETAAVLIFLEIVRQKRLRGYRPVTPKCSRCGQGEAGRRHSTSNNLLTERRLGVLAEDDCSS